MNVVLHEGNSRSLFVYSVNTTNSGAPTMRYEGEIEFATLALESFHAFRAQVRAKRWDRSPVSKATVTTELLVMLNALGVSASLVKLPF